MLAPPGWKSGRIIHNHSADCHKKTQVEGLAIVLVHSGLRRLEVGCWNGTEMNCNFAGRRRAEGANGPGAAEAEGKWADLADTDIDGLVGAHGTARLGRCR